MKWKKNSDGSLPGAWLPGVAHSPGLGLRRGKLAFRTVDQITRFVVHHTGVGVLKRFKRDKHRFGWGSPTDAAVHVYTRIMNAAGHYVVGYQGEVVQIVPDDFAAWHAGYGSQRRSSRMADKFTRLWYDRRDSRKEPRWFAWNKRRYEWWQDRWYNTKGYTSPTAWFPKLRVNDHSLGIELVSTPGHEPFPHSQLYGGPLGPGLVGLVERLSSEYAISVDKDHVLTHSDVVPLARTTKSGRPWDPPPEKYSFQEVFG